MMHAILKNEITVDIRLLILVIYFFQCFRYELVYLPPGICANLVRNEQHFFVNSYGFFNKASSTPDSACTIDKIVIETYETIAPLSLTIVPDALEPYFPSL